MYNKERADYAFHELVKRGFSDDSETKIAAAHLAKKPDENLEPLIDRMEKIRTFCDDPVNSSILAASYYGMEELQMRIPRLEETLVNPFGTGRNVNLLSGTILIADGGPAEGAKAIGLYLNFMRNGLDLSDESLLRLLGLLCIFTVNPAKTVSDLLTAAKLKRTMQEEQSQDEDAGSSEEDSSESLTRDFVLAGCDQIAQYLKIAEKTQSGGISLSGSKFNEEAGQYAGTSAIEIEKKPVGICSGVGDEQVTGTSSWMSADQANKSMLAEDYDELSMNAHNMLLEMSQELTTILDAIRA